MDANGIRMVYGNLHVEHPKKCQPKAPNFGGSDLRRFFRNREKCSESLEGFKSWRNHGEIGN